MVLYSKSMKLMDLIFTHLKHEHYFWPLQFTFFLCSINFKEYNHKLIIWLFKEKQEDCNFGFNFFLVVMKLLVRQRKLEETVNKKITKTSRCRLCLNSYKILLNIIYENLHLSLWAFQFLFQLLLLHESFRRHST